MILPSPVVSPNWLVENLDAVRVVDVRWSMEGGPKRAAFEEAHLPGAVFVDLDADLSAPAGSGGRHPLPDPERFAAVRARLGLDERPVVAYDDQSGATAGRLWWMLDSIGLAAAVLDGGIQAWPGDLEAGPAEDPNGAAVDPRAWPEDRFVIADEVEAAIAGGGVLVDARSAERFRGEPNPIDPRLGHVPGAVSRPWTDNVGPDGRLLPVELLRRDFERLGVGADTALMASCGSGVTGCHDLLAARLIGIEEARLYTGSWSEWALDEARPVATGDAGSPTD